MSSRSLAGRVLAGRYKLDRHLAQGAMGAVWAAEDLTLGVPVAVKLMSVEGATRSDLRARFDREARAVALLRTPQVVQVLDHGTEDDTPFIVMELLEGIDLLEAREQGEPWPLSEIAELVVQVAGGLSAAHRAGLIHRDVKHANIFLSRTFEPGEVVAKLIDFGIVKWADDKDVLTAANVALGSPSFMSPEQIRGQRLDGRVDAWALAVVAFSLVTGDMPFVGKNGPDIARQVVLGNRKKTPPGARNAVALERFFAHAFAPSLDARYGSVEELAGEFVIAADAPTPLRTAARAVARALGTSPTLEATQRIAGSREDAVTHRLDRSRSPLDASSGELTTNDPATDEDLEETEC